MVFLSFSGLKLWIVTQGINTMKLARVEYVMNIRMINATLHIKYVQHYIFRTFLLYHINLDILVIYLMYAVCTYSVNFAQIKKK